LDNFSQDLEGSDLSARVKTSDECINSLEPIRANQTLAKAASVARQTASKVIGGNEAKDVCHDTGAIRIHSMSNQHPVLGDQRINLP
jgi:hypothetical protein